MRPFGVRRGRPRLSADGIHLRRQLSRGIRLLHKTLDGLAREPLQRLHLIEAARQDDRDIWRKLAQLPMVHGWSRCVTGSSLDARDHRVFVEVVPLAQTEAPMSGVYQE